MAEEIAIRFLGPVTGVRDREPIDLGPPRQQATLAVLASRIGRVVTMSQIVDALWGSDPPRTAEQSVYTYVAGLRRAFEPLRGRREPPTLLVGAAGGYALRLSPHQVDIALLTGHLDRARMLRRSGDHLESLEHLNSALDLWRGPALSGVPGPFAERERARLEQLRTDAYEWRSEALIELGQPQDALVALQQLTGEHPLRERARELLMVALERLGRPAEALQIFDEGRRVLAEELGVNPGEGLRRRHESLLRDSDDTDDTDQLPSVPSIPHQLPRELAGFVGRAREIIQLRGVLAPWDETSPHPLVAISGPPGMGKSVLAVRLAHQIRDRFPDGELYVDLSGATPSVPPLPPLDVIGRLLRSLGMPGGAVPTDVDEAAAMWRDRLRGRRVLVLLDDADSLSQIRPLLGIPEGNSILVTSRESLLASDDCLQIRLPRMNSVEATTLLAKLVGAHRLGEDPAATETLVQHCEGLPLALKIVGARLADQPGWSPASLSQKLSDERRRLSELEIGDLAIRASLMSSWKALRASPRLLDASAARVLAQLGVLRLPTLSADTVAALTGISDAEAERSLERLANANLVDRARPGYYHLHDLVRLFVSELGAVEPHAALTRTLSFYTASARQASALLDPHRVQPTTEELRATPLTMNDRDAALHWLEAEESNIGHAALQAMADDDAAIARLGVALAFSVMWYQFGAHLGAELVKLNSVALEVGERLGDELIRRLAHIHVSNGLRMLSRLPEGIGHLKIALKLARSANDRFDEQRTLGNLATLHVTLGDLEGGLGYAKEQLACAREIGTLVGERFALLVIGEISGALNRHEEARKVLEDALSIAIQAGDTLHEASARTLLGEVCLDAAEWGAALDHFRQGNRQYRAIGYKIGELRCLVGSSQAHRAENRLDEALEAIDTAMPLARTLGNARWERRAEEEQAAVHEALGVPAVRGL